MTFYWIFALFLLNFFKWLVYLHLERSKTPSSAGIHPYKKFLARLLKIRSTILNYFGNGIKLYLWFDLIIALGAKENQQAPLEENHGDHVSWELYTESKIPCHQQYYTILLF